MQLALEGAGNRDLTVRLLPDADHALLVRPSPQAPRLAERPAGEWVAEMIEWALTQRLSWAEAAEGGL